MGLDKVGIQQIDALFNNPFHLTIQLVSRKLGQITRVLLPTVFPVI